MYNDIDALIAELGMKAEGKTIQKSIMEGKKNHKKRI